MNSAAAFVKASRISSGRASTSATDWASPCLTCTSLPWSFRMNFMSWLPGTQRADAVDDHVANQPQRVENPWATVHQIAEEDDLAALGMPVGAVAPGRIVAVRCDRLVAECLEQCFQFVAAAVQIADDVERPVVVPLVVPERRPLDRRPPRLPRACRR